MATRMLRKLMRIVVSTGFVWMVLVLIGALGLAVSVRAAGARNAQDTVAAPVVEPQEVPPAEAAAVPQEAAAGDATTQAGPPIVDGLFYSSGENPEAGGPYRLLAENPSESKLFYYLDVGTNLLYASLVISPGYNDNVFGDTGDANDIAYVQSAGWRGQSNQHDFVALYNSDHAVWSLFCGGNAWAWQQDYLWDLNYNHLVTESDWLSNPYGSDGTPPPPAFISSASSMSWNMNFYANHPTIGWNITLGGLRTDWRNWKSYAFYGAADRTVTDTLDNWPRWVGTYPNVIWEWPLVYECVIDLSVCGGNPFTLWPVTGHNSPPKLIGAPNETSIYEWGDLPDTGPLTGTANYQTLLSDNGPRHRLITSLFLGRVADPDTDGQPNTSATGDDVNPPGLADDEDAAYAEDLLVALPTGRSVRVMATNRYTATAYLYGFVDFNGDGTFSASEIASTTVGAGTGLVTYTLSFPTPTTVAGVIYSRFRLSTNRASVTVPTGLAPDGEVEDYEVSAPTSVNVYDFRTQVAHGHVVVQWETSPGVGMVGFNLFRQDARTKQFVQVNEDLIFAFPDDLQSGTHRYVDEWAQPGKTYTYRLVAVDLTGAEATYGPFEVKSPLWPSVVKGGRVAPE